MLLTNYVKRLSYNIFQHNYTMKNTHTTSIAEIMLKPFGIHNNKHA